MTHVLERARGPFNASACDMRLAHCRVVADFDVAIRAGRNRARAAQEECAHGHFLRVNLVGQQALCIDALAAQELAAESDLVWVVI